MAIGDLKLSVPGLGGSPLPLLASALHGSRTKNPRILVTAKFAELLA